MIKVMLVDDSAIVCAMLNQIMTDDSRFDVIGMASNGEKAVLLNEQLKPDLIIMDIHMPVLDGIEATKKILSTSKPAIIVYTTEDSADLGYKALEAGALDVINKPNFATLTADVLRKFCNQLYEISSFHIKKSGGTTQASSISSSKVASPIPSKPVTQQKADSNPTVEPQILVKPERSDYKLLVIGASTGGPAAIQAVLSGLGSTFPLPILITQHIDELFDNHFSKWLNETTGLRVELAKNGTTPQKGWAYIAPANKHMLLKKSRDNYEIVLSDEEPVHFLRPAVDKLFTSASEISGRDLIAVLLTGMGKDGAQGLLSIKKAGGYTIAEHESSCIVYGMPRAAVECNAANAIIPLTSIADFIKKNFVK